MYICCVPGCQDTKSTRHRFPIKDADAFRIWLERIGKIALFDMEPVMLYKSYRICTNHFHEYCRSPGTRTIKHGSLPTLGLPAFSPQGIRDCHMKLLTRQLSVEAAIKQCHNVELEPEENAENLCAVENVDSEVKGLKVNMLREEPVKMLAPMENIDSNVSNENAGQQGIESYLEGLDHLKQILEFYRKRKDDKGHKLTYELIMHNKRQIAESKTDN